MVNISSSSATRLDGHNGRLSREEGIALGIAIAAHVLLVAALTISNPGKKPVPAPERMTVTISSEIADQSTSPDPNAQSMPDVAPELGEAQPELAPAPVEAAKPAPVPLPTSAKPVPAAKTVPQPTKPQPNQAAAKPATKPGTQASRPTQAPAGGSRLGNDFLRGIPSASQPGTSRNQPAAALGPAERASLAGAIASQLKRHWAAPQGADAEKLITILAWDLNPDGSLSGAPRVVRQEGITDANRAQAPRHAEQAIRAVKLAAPFNLPDQYYNGWKRVAAFRFDRKLSQ